MKTIDEVDAALAKAGVFFLATVDGDKPRTRPISFKMMVDGQLYFGVGCIEQPLLMQLAGYLSFLTVKGLSFEQFHQKLQTLGSVINFGCTDSDFKIMVTGFDDHF